jgi:predicted nucleic acid-binding Zn ribbon protein
VSRKREKPVSSIIAEVFRRGGMQRSVRRARVVLLWPQVVGTELARFTRASSFHNGILYVDAPDSETAMHLTLQRMQFVEGYRELGLREVREIRFQPGREAVDRSEPPPVRAVADPGELGRLLGQLGELELPAGIAAPAIEVARGLAAARAQRRQLGWTGCEVCGTETQSGPLCLTCARYERLLIVQRAAQRLVATPDEATPELTDGQRSVAVRLACGQLDGHVLQLLPQVLANPKLRADLARVVANLLALQLGKRVEDVTEEDHLTLPPRVARILGHW